MTRVTRGGVLRAEPVRASTNKRSAVQRMAPHVGAEAVPAGGGHWRERCHGGQPKRYISKVI